MASINKVIIIGNLGKDPETRHAPSGDAFCTITVATTDSWKDKLTGEKKEVTEWHRVVFNGRLAEIAGQYLKKGRSVYIEGNLRTRKWTNKDGVEQYTTEIRADQMQMLGSREGGSENGLHGTDESSQQHRLQQQRQAPALAPAATGRFDPFDGDDIPF